MLEVLGCTPFLFLIGREVAACEKAPAEKRGPIKGGVIFRENFTNKPSARNCLDVGLWVPRP